MTKYSSCFSAIMLFAASCTAADAYTNPEDVAARCVDEVQAIDRRVTTAISDETQRCVGIIQRLVANNRHEAARQVARDCIERARTKVRAATMEIESLCDRCTGWLVDLGLYKLARRVNSVCKDTIDGFSVLLSRQEEVLRNALRG